MLRDAIRAALPKEQFGDHLTILSGTGQNIAGLGIFVAATFATNVLISRAFGTSGPSALGTVTLATQFAFIGGAATRFGMDMAAVRRVAIDVGKGEPGRVRAMLRRAAAIAAAVSLAAGVLAFLGAGALARAFGAGAGGKAAFQAAAVALPFVALVQVYLGGTRGLKIMRHTLSIYWAGQPVAWMMLMLLGWVVSKSIGMSVLAYSLSWVLATAAAWFVWERETRGFAALPAEPGEVRELVRYGTPRAPAAVLSQLLFWADYFVFSRYARGPELGVYAAAVRVAQALALFLIAVNYMFSPFVADLHSRGERERLDGLYKALTRWVVAGTLPVLLLLAVVPGPVLEIFGGRFETGTTALRILLIGQAVNVAVGGVGFILIMVGRTGWDLVVYAASFLVDLGVAFVLAPRLGAEGAAIAQAATMVVSNTGRLYLVWRFVHIQPFNRHYLRLAVPAAAGGLVMLAVHLALRHGAWPADLAGTGVAGAVAYVGALVAFGLAPGERAALRRVWAAGSTP
ncbi:MAG TPA: lipopolysaccharide biosynthesis protein [Actinomycetota bacterium]